MKDSFPLYLMQSNADILCLQIENVPRIYRVDKVLHDYALILLFENWHTIWQLDSGVYYNVFDKSNAINRVVFPVTNLVCGNNKLYNNTTSFSSFFFLILFLLLLSSIIVFYETPDDDDVL